MKSLYESLFNIPTADIKSTVNVARVENICNNANKIFRGNDLLNALKSGIQDKSIYISDDNVLYLTGLKLPIYSRVHMKLDQDVKNIFDNNVIRGISFSSQGRSGIDMGECIVRHDLDMKTSEGRFEIINPSKSGINEFSITNDLNNSVNPILKNIDIVGKPINRLFIKQIRLEDCTLNCNQIQLLAWNMQYPVFHNCQLRSTTDLTILPWYKTKTDAINCVNDLLDHEHNLRQDLLKYIGITSDKIIKDFRLKIMSGVKCILWISTESDMAGDSDFVGVFHVDGISKSVYVWYKEI